MNFLIKIVHVTKGHFDDPEHFGLEITFSDIFF